MVLDCLGSLLELHDHLKRGCHMHNMKFVARQAGTIFGGEEHCQSKWESFITLCKCMYIRTDFYVRKII